VQTLVLTVYLLARAPGVLKAIIGLWKPSLFAGFMGAFASQFWFLAFALTAGRQCAHAGAGRGAVRTGDRVIIRSSSRYRRANSRASR